MDVADLLKQGLRKDREKAIRAVEKLGKLAKGRSKGKAEAVQALRQIAVNGKTDVVRGWAGSSLAEVARPDDREAAVFFREHLDHPDLCYAFMTGLIKTEGPAAYPDLVRIAKATKQTVEHRGLAVQLLAQHSGHAFDRQLPRDFHEWKPRHLLLKEIDAWVKSGYPEPKQAERDVPKSDLGKLGVVLPQDYAEFLRSHAGRVELVYHGNAWRLATADGLLAPLTVDRRKTCYVRQLDGYVRTLSEVFDSDSTVDDKGRPYPLARLADGIAIGDDGSGNVLYLDPQDDGAAWVFHPDGGDVKKLAPSFRQWIAKTKQQES